MKTQMIEVRKGVHRGQAISGRFQMTKPYSRGGSKGGFATVWIDGYNHRIYCKETDFQVIGGGGGLSLEPQDEADTNAGNNSQAIVQEAPEAEVDYEALVRATETEEEAAARIKQSFDIIATMARGAVKGTVRGLIVSGPPGIGKSFNIEATVRAGVNPDNYEIVKGTATPIALYQILYRNRRKGNVVVLDDCDDVFKDEQCLNLLKAVLDTNDRRHVCWMAESRILRDADIPDKFEFHGSVILLTNLNFDKVKNKSLQPHLEALKSRCFYIDLGISNRSDMLVRIKTLVADGMLDEFELLEGQQKQVTDFVTDYVEDLQELSLRTVVKLAGLRKAAGDEWQVLAVHSILKPAARWRWMQKARQAKS